MKEKGDFFVYKYNVLICYHKIPISLIARVEGIGPFFVLPIINIRKDNNLNEYFDFKTDPVSILLIEKPFSKQQPQHLAVVVVGWQHSFSISTRTTWTQQG